MKELSQQTAYSIRLGGKQYYAISPEILGEDLYLSIVKLGTNFQMLFPSVGDIYRFAAPNKVLHSALSMIDIANVVVNIPAKSPLYYVGSLFGDKVSVRLPHNASEKEFVTKLNTSLLLFMAPELTETEFVIEKGYVVDTDESGVVTFDGESLKVETGNEDTLRLYTFFEEIKKNKAFRFADKFPLFRQKFISIFWGNHHEAVEMILDRIQKRFQEKRSMTTIKPSYVVTPNLDHLRMLVTSDPVDQEFRDVYAGAFMQVADGYPPLVKYAKQSIGYQTKEQVSGVELFVSLMNRIGQEDLPYTIYFVGGFQQTAYIVRDHFVSAYPNMAKKIVGISCPPVGFMDNNRKIFNAIIDDINRKRPDFVFACLAAPQQEKFVYRLMQKGVNFGLGFGLGRTFDLISGYQKKEAKIIENLRLVWLFRAFTKKTYAVRALKGLQFALSSVLKA